MIEASVEAQRLSSRLLTRHPAPFTRESPLGYILRLSEVNGFSSPWAVLKLAGMAQGEVRTAGMTGVKLASVTGLARCNFEAISLATDNSRESRLAGHLIIPSDLNMVHAKFCPQCLAELGYMESYWHLTVMIACPVHGCSAVTHCHTCNKPLTWFRPGLAICKCGVDLSHAEPDRDSPELKRLLEAVLHSMKLNLLHGPLPEPYSALSRLDPRTLLRLIASVGQLKLRVDVTAKRNSRAESVRAAAFVFSEWPKRFFEFMTDEGRRSVKSSGAMTVSKQFAALYSLLFKAKTLRDCVDLDIVRNAFVSFATNHWAKAPVDDRLFKRQRGAASEKRYLTTAEFARRAGVQPITAKRYLLALASETGCRTASARLVVDRTEVSIPSPKPGSVLRCREAAKLLDVPSSLLSEMKRSGLYETSSMLPSKPGYHMHDLYSFRDRLMAAQSPRLLLSPREEQQSLGQVLRSPHTAMIDKMALLRAVTLGTVPILGRSTDLISGLIVDRKTVAIRLGDLCTERGDNTVSFKAAASQLRCDAACIGELVRRGLLEGVAVRAQDRMRIQQASIEAFRVRTDILTY